MQRYQVDAVSKIIGGVDFEYSVKGDPNGFKPVKAIDTKMQKRAFEALLSTLDAEYLEIPKSLLEQIPPPAFGYQRDRETFKGKMGSLFDPISAAEASANHSLKFLLNPQRLARLVYQNQKGLGLGDYLSHMTTHIFPNKEDSNSLSETVQTVYFIHLLKLSKDQSIAKSVNMHALSELNKILLISGSKKHGLNDPQTLYFRTIMSAYNEDPENYKLPSIPDLPPGSPIGCH